MILNKFIGKSVEFYKNEDFIADIIIKEDGEPSIIFTNNI